MLTQKMDGGQFCLKAPRAPQLSRPTVPILHKDLHTPVMWVHPHAGPPEPYPTPFGCYLRRPDGSIIEEAGVPTIIDNHQFGGPSFADWRFLGTVPNMPDTGVVLKADELLLFPKRADEADWNPINITPVPWDWQRSPTCITQ